MITEYNDFCIICNKPRMDMHHIFKGVKQRRLADEDGLVIPLCQEHHTGNMSVHQRKELNILCEIIGQLAWERNTLIEMQEIPFDDLSRSVREEFRQRYGRSYL